MSRIILNQIALQKIKVISETKKYFLLQPSSAAAPRTSNYGITPPTYTQTGYSGWSNTEPSYTVGDDRVLYELTETIYSDRTWDYSTPTISSSYKAAKEAYNEAIQAEEDIQDFVDLGLKQGYIWDNPTSKPASGTIPVYPAGSYIASGILSGGTRSINRSNSNTYGLNTWISTGGINLRYNAIDLMKLTTSNLFFYYPSTSTQQKKAISLGTNGAVNSLAFYGFNNDNKTMELTNNALTFYNPSNGTDPLATLNANGLVLSKGGITVDTVGSNDGMYISSEDLGSAIPSLVPTPSSGTPKTNWRAVIGSKFGVDSEGNLYANEAHISGEITASKLTISSNATISDTSGLISNSAVEVGGRNFIPNTAEPQKGNIGSSTTITDDYATLAGSTADWSAMWGTSKMELDLLDGTTVYIVSFEYRSTAALSDTLLVISGSAETTDSSSWTRSKYANWKSSEALPSTGGEWVKHSLDPRTISLSQLTSGSGDVNSFFLQLYNRSDGVSMDVRHFKLERGNKVTDWAPAPEDIQNALGNKTENSDFDEYKGTVSQDLKDITDSAFGDEDSLATRLSSVSTEFGSLSTEYGELSNDINTYMSFDGALVLGNSESGKNVTITDTRINFMDTNKPIGYIDGDGLHVNKYLSFGNFMFYQRSGGHFTLKYLKKEDSE